MNTESNLPVQAAGELKNHLGWFIGLDIGPVILGTIAFMVPLMATFAIESLIGIL
jgi:uncharacterized membrane protein HdeD (DUF308 family)